MDDCKLIEINNTCLVREFPDIEFREDCVIPQPQLKSPLNGVSDCPLIDTRPGSPTFGQSNLCVCWFPVPAGNGNPAANVYLVQSSFDESFAPGTVNEQLVEAPETQICYNLFETTGTIREGATIYWRVIAAYIDEDTAQGCVSLKSETRSFTITCGSDDFNKQLCERYNVDLTLQGPDFVKNCECCTYWIDGSADCFDFAGNQILRIIEDNPNGDKDDPDPVNWSISPEIVDPATFEFGEGRKSIKLCPCVEETQSVNLCSKIWFETNVKTEDFFLPDYENPDDAPESEFVVFSCDICKKITVDAATETDEKEVISNLATTDQLKSITTCGISLNSNSCTDLKVNVRGIVEKFDLAGCPPGHSFLPFPNCDCKCFPDEMPLQFQYTPPNSTKCYTVTSTGKLQAGRNPELARLKYDLFEQDEPLPLTVIPEENCKLYCFNPTTGDCRLLTENSAGNVQCPVGYNIVDECPRLYCRDNDGVCHEVCPGGESPCNASSYPAFCNTNGFDFSCATDDCDTTIPMAPRDCDVLSCSTLTEPVNFTLLDPGNTGLNAGDFGDLFPNGVPNSAPLGGNYQCQSNIIILIITIDGVVYRNQITSEDLLCGKKVKLYTEYSACTAGVPDKDSIEIQILPFVFQRLAADIVYTFDDIVFDDPQSTTLIKPCMTLEGCSETDDGDEDTDDPSTTLNWQIKYCIVSDLCTSDDPLFNCTQCETCDRSENVGPSTFNYTLNYSAGGGPSEEISGTMGEVPNVALVGDSIFATGPSVGTPFINFDDKCSDAGFVIYYDAAIEGFFIYYKVYDPDDAFSETFIEQAEYLFDIDQCGQSNNFLFGQSLIVCEGEEAVSVTIDLTITTPDCQTQGIESTVSTTCDGADFEFQIEHTEEGQFQGGKVVAKSTESCFLCEQENEVILVTNQDIPFDRCYFDVNKQGQISLKKTAFYAVILDKVRDDENCYKIFSGQTCDCVNIFPLTVKIDDLEFFVPAQGVYTARGRSACTECKVSEYRLQVSCNPNDEVELRLTEYCEDTGEFHCFTGTDGDQLIRTSFLSDEEICNGIRVCRSWGEFDVQVCGTTSTGTVEFSNHGYLAEDVFNLVQEGSSCETGRVFVQLDQNTKRYVITNFESLDRTVNMGPFCAIVDSLGDNDECGSSSDPAPDPDDPPDDTSSRDNVTVRCINDIECDCDSIQSRPMTVCLGTGASSSSGADPFTSEVFIGTEVREFPDAEPMFLNCDANPFTIVSVGVSCRCDNIVLEVFEACFETQAALDIYKAQGGFGNPVAIGEVPIEDCDQDALEFELLPNGTQVDENGNPPQGTPTLTGKIKFTIPVENCLDICVEKDSKVWVDYDSCSGTFNLVSVSTECANGLRRYQTYVGTSQNEGFINVSEAIETLECEDAEGTDDEGNAQEYLVFVDDCCEITCCKKKDDEECPDIIWCCCGDCDPEKELILATAQSCAKLGGLNLGLVDEVSEETAQRECDEQCKVWCCNESAGSCTLVLAEDCSGDSYPTQADCEVACTDDTYCCDPSTGQCVEDPNGVSLEECVSDCRELTDCCCIISESLDGDNTTAGTATFFGNTSSGSMSDVDGFSRFTLSSNIPNGLCDEDIGNSYIITLDYEFIPDPNNPEPPTNSVGNIAFNGQTQNFSGGLNATQNLTFVYTGGRCGISASVTWIDPLILGYLTHDWIYTASDGPCDTAQLNCFGSAN